MALPVLAAARIGVEALRVNPLRTILSTLGVIIGVGALTAVLSLSDSMEGYARSQIERTTDVQTVSVAARTGEFRDGQWIPVRNYPVFTALDAREMEKQVPSAGDVALTVSGQATVGWGPTGRERRVGITAGTAGAAELLNLKFREGRFFTPAEATRNAGVVVLSYKLAAELASGRAPERLIGERVRVNGAPREVIGVLAPFRGERSYSAYVPFSGAASALGASYSRDAPQLLLHARRAEDVPAMREQIEEWLAIRYGRWEGRVEIRAQEARLEQLRQAYTVMRLSLGTLAGISLLVGGIGIMNILLASVTERTREIGIRKALGARQRDVLMQFLAEAVAVSGVGSALGLALGTTLSAIATLVIRRLAGVDDLGSVVTAATLIVAALSAVVIGLTFGTYPARRAARLSPIDAIRHE